MICCCVSDRNFLDYPDERGVIAFLNGVDLEESLFSSGLLVAKIVGVTFACGSSLAVGPEGPMIHIGATIGTVQKKGETCQPYQNALRFHCLHCMTVKLVENKEQTPCQPRCLDLQMPRANQVFGWHPSQPRRESLYPASRCCSWCRMWRGSCIWSSDSRCSLKCSFIFLHCWCQNDSNANSKARWLDANQILFEQFTRGIARLLSACLIEKNDNSMVEDWWSCQRRNTICCWRGGHLFVTAVLHSCVLSVLLVTDRCASGYPTVLWTTVGNSNMAIHSFVSGIHRPELFTYSSHFFHHLWIDRYCLWPLGECFQPNRSGVELSTS